MSGRSLGIAVMALFVVFGAVRCTSAETDTSAHPADSSAVALPADSLPPPTSAIPPPAAIPASTGRQSPPRDRVADASPEARPRVAPAPLATGAEPAMPTVEIPDEGARVAIEIERTDRALTAVRNKAERSTNRRARQEYQAAVQRQAEARESLEESFFARASRLTLEARAMAERASVHLGPPEEDPEFVSTTLGRTDDALGRAKEIIDGGGGPAERRRLNALESGQKEARALYKGGNIRASYEATRTVRDGVLTLLRQCDRLPVPSSTAERALKRAARSLDLAEPELGDRVGTAVRRLVRDARAQLTKARVAFARKNYRDTLLHSKLVERKLELALAAQRSATNRSG